MCACNHEGGEGRSRMRNPLLPPPPHRRGSAASRREAQELREGRGDRGSMRLLQKPSVDPTARCHADPQALPPHRPPLHEVPWAKLPASYNAIRMLFKEVQNRTTVIKWELLCQAPSKPERLPYSLMKFLLQSPHLSFTGEQRFL